MRFEEAFNELINDADGDLKAALDALCDGEYLKQKGYSRPEVEELYAQVSSGLSEVQEAHANQA